MVESERIWERILGRETWRHMCAMQPVKRGKHSNTSYSTALGWKSGELKSEHCTDPELKNQSKSLANSCSEA